MKHSARFRNVLIFGALVSAAPLALSTAQAAEKTNVWIGGTDDWSNTAAWSLGEVPTNSVDSYWAIIDGDTGTDSIASVNFNAKITTGTVTTGDRVEVLNGNNFQIDGGEMEVDGVLRVASTGSVTQLSLLNDSEVSGSGVLQLSDNSNNWVMPTLDGTFEFGPSLTVEGSGHLAGNQGGFVNYGIIDANNDTNYLEIDTRQPQTLENYGALRATGTAGLRLNTATVQNYSNPIFMDSGSQIYVRNSTLYGHGNAIQVNGSGYLNIENSTIYDLALTAGSGMTDFLGSNTLNGASYSGQATQKNGSTVQAINDLPINGDWTMDASLQDTSLIIANGGSLIGPANIFLSNSAHNRIYPSLNQSMVIESGISITGAGQFGLNEGGIGNHGQITQQGSATMTIDTRQPMSFDNFGTLAAEGTGGIHLNTSDVNNYNSPIAVSDGSKLNLTSSKLYNNGQDIDLQGTAAMSVSDSTIGDAFIYMMAGVVDFFGTCTLDAVGSYGVFDQNNGSTVYIDNDLAFDGVWNMLGSGNWTNLVVRGDGILDVASEGTLELALTDNMNNRVYPELNKTLTLGNATWLHGAGHLGVNEGGFFIYGSLVADGANPLTIDTRQPMSLENYGHMEATGTGGFNLNTANVNNYNYPILVADGSRFDMNSSTLDNNGLRISLANSAQMNVANSTIRNAEIGSMLIVLPTERAAGEVTYSGNVNLDNVVSTTTVVQENGSTVNVADFILHTGPWYMNAGGNWTNLVVNGGGGFFGTSDLILSDSGNNRIYPELNQMMTFGPDIWISGAGQLGVNEGGFYSEATITADGTAAIRIDTRQPMAFENMGKLSATGPGGLIFSTANVVNYNDPIIVDTGSKLEVSDSTLYNNGLAVLLAAGSQMLVTNSSIHSADIVSGVLFGRGIADIVYSGNVNLTDVNSTGTVVQSNASTVNIYGGLHHDGIWEMQGGGNWTNLIVYDGDGLWGPMDLILSDSSNNRVYPELNENMFIASDVQVSGAGQFGVNNGGFYNEGSIVASGSNLLRIDTRQPMSFENYGTVRAAGMGGLLLDTTDFNNYTNPIVVEPTSQMSINSSTLDGNWTELILQAPAPLAVTNSTVLGVQLLAENTTATLSGNVNLSDVPATGTIVQTNLSTVNIYGDQFLNGTWNMMGTTNWTNLIINNYGTLYGPMNLVLSDSVNNRIYPELDGEMTFGPNVSVSGAGQLGVNNGGFYNEGKLIAEGTSALTIDTRQPQAFVNTGIVEAVGPGGLILNTSNFDNSGAPLIIHDGSKLFIENSSYFGNTTSVSALGGGNIGVTNSSISDTDVSLEGGTLTFSGNNSLSTVAMSGHVVQNNNSTVTIADGYFAQNGPWDMQGGANETNIIVNGGNTLGGTGIMSLTGSIQNRIFPALDTVMRHGLNHSIEGAGQMILNQGGLINEGRMTANLEPGMSFDIRSGYNFLNMGLLEAISPGTISITDSNLFTNLGYILIDQSTLTADQDLAQNSGTTELRTGQVSVNNTFTLNDGTLAGSGFISGNLTNVSGLIAPDTSIGVSGTLHQGSLGTMAFDVFPLDKHREHHRGIVPSASGNDEMSIGIMEFGGRLEVVFNGYTPSENEEFTLLFFEVGSGTFNEVVGINLPEGFSLQPIYESSSMRVRVTTQAQPETHIVNSALIPISPGRAMVSFRDDRPTSVSSYLISVARVTATGTWVHEEIVNYPTPVIRSARFGETPVFDLPLVDPAEPTSWEGDYSYTIMAYSGFDATGESVFGTEGSQPIASTDMQVLNVQRSEDGTVTLRLADARPTGSDTMYDYIFYEQTFTTSRSVITPLYTTNNGRTGVMSASDVGTSTTMEYSYHPNPGAIGWYVKSLATVYGADGGRIGQFDIGFQSPYVHDTIPFTRSTRDTDGDGFGDELEVFLGASPKDPNHRPSFGDVDGDGATTVLDAVLLSRLTGEKAMHWKSYQPVWDVDCDGDVDRADSEALYLWAIGGGEFDYLPAK
ncbi:hypothetical protein KQI84_13015 [bacterium]|nr:hypothetical protein [bacterium]